MPLAEELGVSDVERVVRDVFGLEGERRGDEFHMLCPVHDDSDPSCDVNLTTGFWNCYSCPAKGDLAGLGKKVLGRPRSEVLKLLQPDTPEGIVTAIQSRLRGRRRDAAPKKVVRGPEPVSVPSWGSYAGRPLTAMTARGFTKETLRRWGVRFARAATMMRSDGNSFTLRESIAIPILSENEVIGWCYRRTDASPDWQPRYLYTPGIVLAEIWFGEAMHPDAETITVVEGALDAMWCDQHGIPAIAILGSNPASAVKINRLAKYREVTLLTDRDLAGAWTIKNLGERLLSMGVPCKVARYHPCMSGNDPQELSGLDLEIAHARSIPWMTWNLKHGNKFQNNKEKKKVG